MKNLCNLIIIFLSLFLSKIAVAEERFLLSDKVEYNAEEEFVEAIGSIRIVFDNYTLNADRIFYDIKKDELWSYGNIKIADEDNFVAFGEKTLVTNKAKEIIIASFILYFEKSNAIVASQIAKRVNKNHIILKNSSYTACPACSNKNPMWQLSARKTNLHLDERRASYKSMFFKVYNVPILYFPYFSHSLPGAKPKSGFLPPNIRHKKLGLPFYIRPKPHIDATITPRLAKNGGLYDFEFRHLTKSGSYKLTALTAGQRQNVSFYDNANNKISSRKIHRYTLNGRGDFAKNNINYGFNLNQVSDRDFLRAHSAITIPYNLSNLYINSAHKSNFWEINNAALQSLEGYTHKASDRLLPEVGFRHSRTLPLFDDSKFTVENYTSTYFNKDLGKYSRSIWELTLSNKFHTNAGQIIGADLYNRADFYDISIAQDLDNDKITFARNIPEARFYLKYPLLTRIRNSNVVLEPTVTLAAGKKKIPTHNKIPYIDQKQFEFDDVNFYSFNRYNGYDFHESGDRLAYGMHSYFKGGDDFSTSLFLGQIQNLSKDHEIKSSIVGRLYFTFKNNLDVYYRFKRKSKEFKSAFDEVGFWYGYNKIALSGGFINLSKSNASTTDAIRQIYLDTNYDYSQTVSLGFSSRLDISNSPRELTRGIGVTYKGDCVSISTYFRRDYTSDGIRGIPKTSDYSIGIGLKTLNI